MLLLLLFFFLLLPLFCMGRALIPFWRPYEWLQDRYPAAELIIVMVLMDSAAYCQKCSTVSPPIALLAFHSVRHHPLILFPETYQQGYELRCDVEQVYLGIFQQTAVAPHLCIYHPLGIRVRRAIHVFQLLKPYWGRNLKYKKKLLEKCTVTFRIPCIITRRAK